MNENKVKSEEPKVILTQGEDGKLKAVSGEKDGKIETVDPTKGNSDKFLKIDTNSNFLENFMKKFSAQFDNPSHTGVYVVGLSAVDKVAAFFDKIIRIDFNDKVLNPYRVKPDGQMQEQGQGKFEPLDLNKLDWKEVEKLGISGEGLQDTLKAMVYGHKSPGLVDIKPTIDGQEFPMQARLSLEQQIDGSIKIVTHPKQEKPDFDKPFMGVSFSEHDKKQLQMKGNGGRVFDLEINGEKVPSLISIDKLTNRFEAVALKDINIPQTLKNAPLSEEQQQGLKEGKAVWVEGMDKRVKQGEEPSKIDRFVQYNASNKNFDFKFSDEQRQQHNQQRQAKQSEGKEQKTIQGQYCGKVWIPKVLLGVPLTDKQFSELVAGRAVYIKNMTIPKPKQTGEQKVEATDQKGQKFNAWVKPSQEESKPKFYPQNPDQAQRQGVQVKPAAESKTQVAVNNHGKTNEATKNVKEPLSKGQTQPTEKQAVQKELKQKQSMVIPKKNKGRKM